METIEVTYDGEYPNLCSGTLTIRINGEEVYNKKRCCEPLGCEVYVDDNNLEHVNKGTLLWKENEAKQFSEELQDTVKKKLQLFDCCCGGCI